MKRFEGLLSIRWFPWLVFIVIGLFILAELSPCSSQPKDIQDTKNKLEIGMDSSFVSLDPTNYRDRNTQVILKNMFDSLTTRDKDLNVVPQLAESWKTLDDNTWEFTLRQGVKFHNGDALTSEDVKFTLDRVIKEGALDGKTSPRRSLLEPLSAVTTIDEYTVRIKTTKPWAILPLMLTLQEIVPMRYMKEVGSQGFEEKPIGTGPFRFLQKEGQDRLVLERFENYYGGSPENPPVQPAPLKYLIFRKVPESMERIGMLQRGGLDLITRISPGAVGILKMRPDIEVLTSPATRSYFAEINMTRPPFNDARVRGALNYAVNMKVVVYDILEGYGKVLPTVLLPNAFAYDASLHPYEYDIELAKKLLAESGFPRDLSTVINSPETNRSFANAIALFLTKAGVRCEVHVVPSESPQDIRATHSKWHLFVTSWGNSTLDPVGILVPKFRTGGRGNYSGYSNEKVDQLLSLADDTLDTEQRQRYYKEVQELIYKDAPMIFGYAADEIYALRKRVKNFMPSSSGMMNMHDVYVEDGD
jgi:peptide/nickel transport system substrate-binding protein